MGLLHSLYFVYYQLQVLLVSLLSLLVGERKQGLQGTHVALLLPFAAQHLEGLQAGLVCGCFVLEDLLETIDGD